MKINLFIIAALACAVYSDSSFGQWVSQVSGTTQNLNSVFATSPTNVFIAGNSGTGLKTTNSGVIWSTMSTGSPVDKYSIRFLNPTTGFVVGSGQEILITSNSGSSWTMIGGGTTALYDGYFTSATSGWVVGNIEVGYGFLYNPTTFNLIQIPAIANKVLRGIYFANSNTGWVVGDGGVIIKTDNSGSAWTPQNSGSINQLNKVMFIDANNGLCVGHNGTILKTTDGGTNWTSSVSGTTANLLAVYYADALNAWAVGSAGTILKSSDGGVNWTPETSGLPSDIHAVHGSDANHVWAVGYGGKILYRDASTSVGNYSIKTNVSVYPTPTNETVTVTFDNSAYEDCMLFIYNSLGQVVKKLENINSGITVLTRGNLSDGTYTVLLQSGDKIIGKGNIVFEGR
jgi:photosystem II stability/assembly factor-like uncharacterized protein